mmetsp:Transcript_16723/g.29533  ORF Transcript_16723/g.29533 Transcript_16723/m.29533 type:complete len:256 (-) Transcript_16723:266-1033(-)
MATAIYNDLSEEEQDEPLSSQDASGSQREADLVMRLTTKEQEVHELRAYISQLMDFRSAAKSYNRFAFADLAVNYEFKLMHDKIKVLEKNLKETKEELDAVQFHPDSVTGKKLLAKCRTLQSENEELGKQLSQGKVKQLESERDLLARAKDELKRGLDEAHQWIEDMEEEREQMYAQIYLLKKQLDEARESAAKGEAAKEKDTRNERSSSSRSERKEKDSSKTRNTSLSSKKRSGDGDRDASESSSSRRSKRGKS